MITQEERSPLTVALCVLELLMHKRDIFFVPSLSVLPKSYFIYILID